MKAIFKFELTMDISNTILQELMSTEGFKKATLDIFKQRMEEDLNKAVNYDEKTSIKVTDAIIEEEIK